MPIITRPSPVRRSPRIQEAARSLRALEAGHERRRIQFHDSAEPVSVPSSVDIGAGLSLASHGSSAWTLAPNSEAERYSNLSTQPPNSQAQRFTDMETVPPSPPREGAEDGAIVGSIEEVEETLGAELVNFSQASDISRAYTFFTDKVTVSGLRSLLKTWNWRQRGTKDIQVAKCMLQLNIFNLSGISIPEVLSRQRETTGYESWLKQKERTEGACPLSVKKAPSEEHFIDRLNISEAAEYSKRRAAAERFPSGSVAAEPRGTSVEECGNTVGTGSTLQQEDPAETSANPETPPGNTSTPTIPRITPPVETANQPENGTTGAEGTNFGINEFARLLITMRDDEDAKAATIAMGQELTRAQLDLGITRGSFWTIIENCYNDHSNRRFLNLAGAVDGVDSTLPPLVYRTGAFLKDKFNDAKADFTQYCERWAASGQNDPDRFKHFLPKLSNSNLTALGQRMMVMFICTRKGTPSEEEHFTNLCCKVIPGGAGRDEGSRFGGGNSSRESFDGHSKRRRSQEPEGITKIASSLSLLASSYNESKAESGPNESKKRLDDYSQRFKKIKILEDVGKKLMTYRPHESLQTEGVAEEDEVDGMSTERSVVLALRQLQRDMKRDLLLRKE